MVYKLFLPDGLAVLQGLHGYSTFTEFFQMGVFIFVVIDPFVKIDLQLLDGLIFFSEFYLIEFLQDGFVQPRADAVALR